MKILTLYLQGNTILLRVPKAKQAEIDDQLRNLLTDGSTVWYDVPTAPSSEIERITVGAPFLRGWTWREENDLDHQANQFSSLMTLQKELFRSMIDSMKDEHRGDKWCEGDVSSDGR